MAAKKAKKYRSKFFRVALEGATCDGRTIERKDIEDMAATYSQGVYGARIWIDHIRGMLPDSPFRAYGDVTAVKAEEVDFNGSKKLALFAQIDPTDDLVAIVNVQKQKVFTSIELAPDFAGSGQAYLYGLASRQQRPCGRSAGPPVRGAGRGHHHPAGRDQRRADR